MLIRLFRGYLLFQFVMLLAEGGGVAGGFALGLFSSCAILLCAAAPGGDAADQICGRYAGDDGARRKLRTSRVSLLRGFMAVELALDAAQRIEAGAAQIFFGIVEFVLIEFHLGLDEVELLLQVLSSADHWLAAASFFLRSSMRL